MSKWTNIPIENVEVDDDELNICTGSDSDGNIYVTLNLTELTDLLATSPSKHTEATQMRPVEPTLQEQLGQIVSEVVTKTLDHSTNRMPGEAQMYKMYIEKATQSINHLIEKAERKARLEELNNLYDEAETPEQYDTCDVVHDHRIAERIKELSSKEKDK